MWLAAKYKSKESFQQEAPSLEQDLLQKSLWDEEAFFDCLQGISPDLFEPIDGVAMVSLHKLYRYWSLDRSTVLLEEKLHEVARRFPSNFILAPTSAQAYYLLQHPELWPSQKQLLLSFEHLEIKKIFEKAPIETLPCVLIDAIEEDRSLLEKLYHFCEELRDLGFENIAQLNAIQNWQAFQERFGPFVGQVFRRLRGEEELRLEDYKAPLHFKHRFFPALEKDMASENSSVITDRIYDSLESWEKRLEARKSLIKGFVVRLQSERFGRSKEIVVYRPRATRSATKLFALFKESIRNLEEDIGFEDEVYQVNIDSLGIEDEVDRQLGLFDPSVHESRESWADLMGRVYAQSNRQAPIQSGAYKSHESYFPENSLEWVDWDADRLPPPIDEHPSRPLFLLKKPRPVEMGIRTEKEFFDYLNRFSLYPKVERVRNPWSYRCEDRSYVRMDERWVYWSHEENRLYVHGYFE